MVWFAARERGTALGVRQMATPLGGAVAAASLPLLALRFGIACLCPHGGEYLARLLVASTATLFDSGGEC